MKNEIFKRLGNIIVLLIYLALLVRTSYQWWLYDIQPDNFTMLMIILIAMDTKISDNRDK